MMLLSFFEYWMTVIYMYFLMLLLIKNYSLNFYCENISYLYGFDSLSSYFMLLSCWICSLMLLSSFKVYKLNNHYKLFTMMIVFLLIMLLMVFSSLNLFMFYTYFEVSMIPLMILIVSWGYQPERLLAGMYLIFYTIFFLYLWW